MVGNLKETLEPQKSVSIFHYVEILRDILHDLQILARKGSVGHRKTAPGCMFCKSGPVAHADDDDDDGDDDDDDDADDDAVCGNAHMQKAPLSQPSLMNQTDVAVANQEQRFSCCEESLIDVDTCVRSFQHQPSESTVKYLWSDGCLYEGEWGSEQRTGICTIYWPSGSSYEGEVMGGNLHGEGTYTGADGTNYKGNWILNKKHGFGRKKYVNGDVYEGLWKWDVPDGQGRYFWNNGSEYSGEWRGGMMCGRGALSWASGDKYEGQWLNSLADGHGVYTWADGGMYEGTWSRGLKDGGGWFYPPGSTCLAMNDQSDHKKQHDSVDESDDYQLSRRPKVYSPSDDVLQVFKSLGNELSVDKLTTSMLSSTLKNGQENGLLMERIWGFEGSAKMLPTLREGNMLSNFDGEMNPEKEKDLPLAPIVKTEYGTETLPSEFAEENPAASSNKVFRRRHRWLLKEQKRPGETIYKGHRSYDLMLNLQLGIRYSVGKITPKRNRKILPSDFGIKARITVNFPRDGSHLTPPHQSMDFKWKDYCPMVFRHLREMFKIDAGDYMMSICGDDGLRELSSPGKSGSVFYLSQDERFMIKTLRKAEVKVFLGMLPKYHDHVQMYENTLITKFFGLHRVRPAGGQKVRFIVMGNVVSTDSWIHRRFDLKGSSQGRSTDKIETDQNTTLKDLDLDFVFHLEPYLRDAVLEQIFRDCQFLESEHIMDYSLLLGLHFKAPQFSSAFSLGNSPVVDLPLHEAVLSRFLTNNAGFVEEEVSSKCLVSISQDSRQDSSSLGRSSSFTLPSTGDADVELLPATEGHCIRLGVNMPAKACRRLAKGKDNLHLREVYDVVLYFGIIDILQEYDMGKKFEHAYKSIQFDSLSISAVDPVLYSKRFQQFMHQIFPSNS